jgi:hypothetical protein
MGVRHVAVSLEQSIAAIAVESGVQCFPGATFCHNVVEAIEEVGFGAEVYTGSSRDIIIPLLTPVVVSSFEVSCR